MTKTSIQGIVFDLGGVLVSLDSMPFFKVWGHRKGKTHAEFIRAIEEWEMYDRWERGNCSEEEFLEAFRSWIGIPSIGMKEFRKHWNGIFPSAPKGMAGMLKKLKKHCPLYVLTNTTDTHIKHLLARYRWFAHFDRIFTSYDLRARKPEPQVFERILAEISRPAESLLYIDDREPNLAAAESLGFRAELCPAPEHLKGVLIKAGFSL
jgi:glucose-1-phosphatase